VIFESSLGKTRQAITRSDLTMNLLRICARSPQTLRQLVRTPSYPGIDAKVHSARTELSVTAAVSDARHHGLVARVGLAVDPTTPQMHAERLRTTLLAFLTCPDLAALEPTAYTAYIDAWFALPAIRRRLGTRHETTRALFLAFPEIAPRSIYAVSTHTEALFGWYRLTDLPLRPTRVMLARLLAGVHRPALPAGRRALAALLGTDAFKGVARRSIERRLAVPADRSDNRVDVVPPNVRALFPERLRPSTLSGRRSA